MHLVLNTYGCFIRENVLKSEYRTMRGRLRKKQLKLAEDVKGAEPARDLDCPKNRKSGGTKD